MLCLSLTSVWALRFTPFDALKAQVLVTDANALVQVLPWVFSATGEVSSVSLDLAINGRDKAFKVMLKKQEAYLLTRTYLASERITLADIAMEAAFMLAYQHDLDEKARKAFRWFNTCIHQSNFMRVLGHTKLCEKVENNKKKGK